MKPTAKKLLLKIIVRLLVGLAFCIVIFAGMVCLMSAIVYKDNTAFTIGLIMLVVSVPPFAVLVWKEVNAYVEKNW